MSSVQQGMTQASYGRKAGRIEDRDAKLAARQIELGAKSRESDRKNELSRALATSIANSGASGVQSFEGSPMSVLSQNIRREGIDTERDAFASELEAMTQRYRGTIAKESSISLGRQAEKAGRSSTFKSIMSIFMKKGSGGS